MPGHTGTTPEHSTCAHRHELTRALQLRDWSALGLLLLALAGLASGLKAAPLASDNLNTLVRFSCLAPVNSSLFRRLETLYRESLAELGFDFEMTSLPETEILPGFKQQRFDGDCARVAQFFTPNYGEHYDIVRTSVQQMSVDVFGRPGIEDLRLNRLKLVAQPGSNFMLALGERYGIQMAQEISRIDEVWSLLEAGKVNGYMAIAELFPGHAEPVQQLNISSHFTLAKYPIYPVLSKKLAHIRPALERVLSRKLHNHSIPIGNNPVIDDANLDQATSDAGSDSIVFSCPVAADNPIFNTLTKGYTRAFAQLGYRFRMVSMSRDREVYELIHSRVDGSCGRINFPDNTSVRPVQVPISISDDNLEIWSTHTGPEITALSQLPPGSKAVYRQSLLSPEQIEAAQQLQLIRKKQISEVLESLNHRQSDFLIEVNLQVSSNIDRIPLEQPIYYRGRIARVQVRPYLSPKMGALARPLARELALVLDNMRAAGEL